jgi:hypothetical protein
MEFCGRSLTKERKKERKTNKCNAKDYDVGHFIICTLQS